MLIIFTESPILRFEGGLRITCSPGSRPVVTSINLLSITPKDTFLFSQLFPSFEITHKNFSEVEVIW